MEVYNTNAIMVRPDVIVVLHQVYVTPTKVRKFMKNFDTGKYVHPFDFKLGRPGFLILKRILRFFKLC